MAGGHIVAKRNRLALKTIAYLHAIREIAVISDDPAFQVLEKPCAEIHTVCIYQIVNNYASVVASVAAAQGKESLTFCSFQIVYSMNRRRRTIDNLMARDLALSAVPQDVFDILGVKEDFQRIRAIPANPGGAGESMLRIRYCQQDFCWICCIR
jgi:hypothetical protein